MLPSRVVGDLPLGIDNRTLPDFDDAVARTKANPFARLQ